MTAPRSGGAAAGRTDRGRVLVVDDEFAIRLVLARALTACGYQVFVAESGAEALAQLSRLVVDAVVSDVTMPSLHGLDLAAIIRQFYPILPILFVSSSTVPVEVLDHPLVGWVRKPPHIDDVCSNLELLMGAAARAAHGSPAR